MHRFGPMGDALDRARLYLLLAATVVLIVALAVLCGCSANIAWTIGPASSAGATASGEHLDPEALEALGGAAGETVKRIVRP